MRESGCLSSGVPLPSGSRLRIELNHQDAVGEFPPGFDPRKTDNRILAVAYSLSKQLVGRVFLVSKDLNLRVKSDVLGIPAQDFYNDKVNYHELYTGSESVDVTADELDAFFLVAAQLEPVKSVGCQAEEVGALADGREAAPAQHLDGDRSAEL